MRFSCKDQTCVVIRRKHLFKNVVKSTVMDKIKDIQLIHQFN